MFRSNKNSPYLFILALVVGVALAVGGSVWATSLGTNVSVTGTLTVSSATASSSITTALGVGTTTPAIMFSVGGASGNATGHGYFTGGLGIGVATTTAGVIETTGAGLIGGVLNVGGVTQLNSTLGVTGLSTLTGGILTGSSATSTIRNLTIVNSTTTAATTTSLSVTTIASTTALVVGGAGTHITSILYGFCDFGPILAGQTIAATTTGTVACTGQSPTGHTAGDRVWLTASTTASGVDPESYGQVLYTGIASSTAAGRIQAMLFNDSGVAWTVTTSSWQYLIIK